jgi:hypothetical protein
VESAAFCFFLSVELTMQKKTIRLACTECSRDDYDGITPAHLKKLIAAGWKDVYRFQTYRQSCKTYEDWSKAPPDFSALEWWTHLGTCPECAEAEGGG